MTPKSILSLNTTSRCFVKLTKPTSTTIPLIKKNFTSFNKPLYSYYDMYNAEHPIQRLYNESSSDVKVSNNGGSGDVHHSSMTYIKNTEHVGTTDHFNVNKSSNFEPMVSGSGNVSGDGHHKV